MARRSIPARALSELDALSASMKFDTSRTESEQEAIRKARVSLQTVGADSVESRRLLRAVFENQDARKQAKIEAANARIADAPVNINQSAERHAIYRKWLRLSR